MSRRLIRPDAGIDAVFQADRHARAEGKEPAFQMIVPPDPSQPAVLPMKAAYDFFMERSAKTTGWENKVTVRSLELLRGYRPGLVTDSISPTPLLMVVAQGDSMMTPADLCLEAYQRAREPKELLMLPGEHFEAYSGKNLETMNAKEIEFMKKWLCS
ncbi:hypothetical protein MMC13_004490 [Lambiella insularis]|nr:hypothetical protein [Lambiella insularis]